MESSSITFRDTSGVDSMNTSGSVGGVDPGKPCLQTGQQEVDVTDALLRQGSQDLKFFAAHAEPSSSEPAQQGSTKRKRKRPPVVPRPKGAFIFYSMQFRAAYKKTHPDSNLTEMTKAAGAAWKALSDEEKKPFVEMATQDKERYAKDKLAHRMESDDGAQKKRKGVFLYFFEQFKKHFDLRPDWKKLSMPELSKEAGKAWQQLSAEEKAKYAEMAKEDAAHMAPEGVSNTIGLAEHRNTSRGTAAAAAAATSSGPSINRNIPRIASADQIPNPLEVYQKQLHDQIHELMGTLKRFHQQSPLERVVSTQRHQANLSPFVPQPLLASHPSGTASPSSLALPSRTIESGHPALLPRPRRRRSNETVLLKGKVLD